MADGSVVIDTELDDNKLKSGLGKLGNVAGKALTGIVASATAAAAAIIGVATASANAGDRVDKMSQKLGLSRDAFQEWDFILSQNGASIDTMNIGMKTLQNAMSGVTESGSSTAAVFEKIGMNFDEVSALSPEEAFESTVVALQGMEEGADKTAAAVALFGRNGQELLPLLNQTAEGTEALRQKAHDLGMVMSDESVDAAVVFTDTLDAAKRSLQGMANTMGASVLPAMSGVIDGFIGLMQGTEGASEQMGQSMNALVESITSQIPAFLAKGSEILLALVKGLVLALPELVAGVMEVIPTIVTTIMEMLPDLLQAAIEIIATVAMGIAEQLPTLIPMAVEMVLTLVMGLIENIGLLIDGAIALMMGLAEGLLSALPVIIEKAPMIVQSLVDAVIENAPKLLTAAGQILIALVQGIIQNLPQLVSASYQIITSIITGIGQYINRMASAARDIVKSIWDTLKNTNWLELGSDIINGIVNGLENAAGAVLDFMKDLASQALNAIKSFFGISSPSKLMAKEVGRWIPPGITVGMENALPETLRKMKSSLGGMVEQVQMSILSGQHGMRMAYAAPGGYSAPQASAANVSTGPGLTINQTVNTIPTDPYSAEVAAIRAAESLRWN